MVDHHAGHFAGAGVPAMLPPVAGSERRALPTMADGRLGIEIDVVCDLFAVEAEWRLFEESAEGTAFQTFAWLSAWQRRIGVLDGTVPAIVIGRDAAGALLFLLPLAVEKSGPFRRLTWLGGRLSDYNGPLLAAGVASRIGGDFPALWRRILALVKAQMPFDFVDLPRMLENVGDQRNPFFDLAVRVNPNGAYVALLGSDWESYYAAKRSGPTRKKERKQLKLLAEHGAVRFERVREPGEIAATIETLMAQKSRSFARHGIKDNFLRPGYRAFYLDVTGDRHAAGMVDVTRFDIGDTVAAASVGLQFGKSYYLVLSSYDDGPLAKLGPGRAHLNELIRHAVERNIPRFDFTIGDEPYKLDWADLVLAPHDHLAAATLKGYAAVAAILGFRWLKRTIKQTPVLWAAFSRAREFVGGLRGGSADRKP